MQDIYSGDFGRISNKAHWKSDVVHFVDPDDGSTIDLTAASAILFEIRDPVRKCALVTATLANGKISHVEDGFQVFLAPDDLSSLCAGQYDANMSFTLGGVKSDPVLARITILEGAG